MRDYNQPPLNPLPPIVWALALPMIAIELVLTIAGSGIFGSGATGLRQAVLTRFALNPDVLGAIAAGAPWGWADLLPYVSHVFVHGSLPSMGFGAALTLGLGKFVSEVFRPWAVATLFLLAGLVGGIAYSLIPGMQVWLYGAMPAAYGLIGALTFLIWTRLGALRADRRQAFLLVGALLAYQLVAWVVMGGPPTWVADIAGFATGFGLSFLVIPGGLSRALRAMRQR